MKILLVSHGFPPQGTGGVELRTSYVAQHLKRRGHEVTVFCRGSDAAHPDYRVEHLEIYGVPVHRVNYLFRDLDHFEGVYENRRIHEIFASALDEIRPDVVHIHHLTCLSTTIPRLLRERGVPQVMSLHDFWIGCPRGKRMRPPGELCPTIDRNLCLPCTEGIWGRMVSGLGPLRRRLRIGNPLGNLQVYDERMRKMLEAPDLLLTPSDFSRGLFLDFGVDPERIRTLPYGLDRSLFTGFRHEESDDFRFCFIGSVMPSKGAHVLLEAFRGLDRPGARLDIHGEIVAEHGDEEYPRRLRTAVEATPLACLHGRFENKDVPAILARADALVVPSVWYETFCITIREGFLAGVPVLASDLGAMSEAIEDGISGLHFRPGDVTDLRLKMRRIADDPDLRRRLSNQGHRVKSIEDNVLELEEIYGEVAARH
jgi:glycosyltransferase involved in cell wall biosynthesis